MFLLIPWKVDVPQDRWPVVNWLIIGATIAVFGLQVYDYALYLEHENARPPSLQPGARQGPAPATPSVEHRHKGMTQVPGVTRVWMLQSWSLKGLLGYMWLHADLLHLLGNMLFLWIFGNAVCAKLGNLRYLGFYVLLGVVAGAAQLLYDSRPQLGASGAINGVVGMYLVLFYENEITCLFAFWFLLPYVRWFAVSSAWIILFWLFWDVLGALMGGSNVGHFAHLGGFAAGFGLAILMCKKGWIAMEKYEKSLLQWWEQRRHGEPKSPVDAEYVRLGLRMPEQGHPTKPSTPEPQLKPIPLPPVEATDAEGGLLMDGFIRTACACGGVVRVSRQYAGRTVRCPRCKQPVVIPCQTDSFGAAPPPPRARLIRFTCGCGKKLRVPAHYAGRTGQCPQCGGKLKVPSISP